MKIRKQGYPDWDTFVRQNTIPFMLEVLNFLKELSRNNHRQWFEANRDWYLEARHQFESLVESLIPRIAQFDKESAHLTPADCIFRIYRDVRFSPNKEPYKTNMGAYFSRGGKNSRFAGYYLHIEPGASFIGGGKWRPTRDILQLIRQEIFHFPEEFLTILHEPEFQNTFGQLSEEDEILKKAPRDFPSDFRYIHLLKYKSYIVGMDVSDEQVISPDFADFVAAKFKVIHPLVAFLNRAIENI